MLFKELIAVFTEIYTKQIQTAELPIAKERGT
jgi:hypothetical protein